MYNQGIDMTTTPSYINRSTSLTSYPPQQSGYPPQESGYPPQQSGYPPQQSGYPPQQSGYPPQPVYPPEQSAYPAQPSGYPPEAAPVQQQPTHTTLIHQQPTHTTQVQQQLTHTSHNITDTTVVIQQQPAAIVVQQARGWSSGLCACFDDCGVCLLGLCSCMLCLPIIECNVSSQAGECCCVGILCPTALRTKIRKTHNIQGTIFDDGCAVACCHCLAMCQMARELNLHGI